YTFYTLSLHDALPIYLPQSILFKHNSLECDTPCEIKEHIFHEGVGLEKVKEFKGEKAFVMNPPFSLAGKMTSKVLELVKNDKVLDRKSTRLNSSHLGI